MKFASRQAIRYQGNILVPVSAPLLRECPRCGAGPGKRCFRMVGRDKRNGEPGHQMPLLTPHNERRKHHTKKGTGA